MVDPAARSPHDPRPCSGPFRRRFLKTLGAGLGAVIAAIFAVPAVRFLAFPVRRRTVAGPDAPIPVADASAVKDRPVRVAITAPEQRDAWGRVTDVPLGAAWLVRAPDGAIRAFTTTCPHLGCSIDYDPAVDRFRCPCHTSAFARDGARLDGPAKRGMDPLETTVDADGRVLVRFVRFKLDVADREVA